MAFAVTPDVYGLGADFATVPDPGDSDVVPNAFKYAAFASSANLSRNLSMYVRIDPVNAWLRANSVNVTKRLKRIAHGGG